MAVLSITAKFSSCSRLSAQINGGKKHAQNGYCKNIKMEHCKVGKEVTDQGKQLKRSWKEGLREEQTHGADDDWLVNASLSLHTAI